jgi:hypothetical protein
MKNSTVTLAAINEALENGTDVVAEQPKAATTVAEPKPLVEKKTPVADRIYRPTVDPLGAAVQLSFKGKQRQQTYNALMPFADNGGTSKQIAAKVDSTFIAKAGTEASVAWHLHQMAIAGIVTISNPTYMG